jgi:hypothetical protein
MLAAIEKRGDKHEAYAKGDYGRAASSLCAAIAPKLGNGAQDQADKHAEHERGIPFKQRFCHSGEAYKSKSSANTDEYQHQPVFFDALYGICQYFKHLVIDAEDVAERSSADTGQDRAYADDKALNYPQKSLENDIFLFFHKKSLFLVYKRSIT